MEDAGRIDSIAPYAIVALSLAGVAWFVVARAAGRRSEGKGGHNVFGLLAGASYFTSAAFILMVLAYLTR
jgi:hypothetical protein